MPEPMMTSERAGVMLAGKQVREARIQPRAKTPLCRAGGRTKTV